MICAKRSMDVKLNVMGFAVDGNPKRLVQMVLEAAEENGHRISFYDNHEDVAFGEVDVFIVGINSESNRDEARLIEQAKAVGAFVVVVEDIHCAHARLPKNIWGGEVDLLLAADSFSGLGASMFGYSSVLEVGPPPHWKADVLTCRSRHYSSEVWVGSTDRIEDDDILLWFGGGKNPLENNIMLTQLAKAVHLSENKKLVVAMTTHPAESEWAKSNDLSLEITEVRPAIYDKFVSTGVRFVNTDHLNTQYLLGRVDVPVVASASTMTIALLYARRPSVFLYNKYVREELVRLGNATETWYLADLGCMASADMDREGSLEKAIRDVVERPEIMIRNMEKLFPTPETFDTSGVWWMNIFERLEDIVTAEVCV